MYELIKFCFDGGDSTYVTVTKYGAKWVSDTSSFPISFGKKAFEKAVNCFFLIWDRNIRADRRYPYEIRPCFVYGQFIPLLLGV